MKEGEDYGFIFQVQGWLNTFYFDNYTIPDDEQQADEAGKERKKERKNK